MARLHDLSALPLMLAAALAGTSACAARDARFTSPFIKDGNPAVTLPGPPAIAPRKQRDDYARQMKELAGKPRPAPALLPTMETTNAALASALTKLALRETAENHRRVAGAYRSAGIDDYAYRHLRRAIRLEPCDADAYDSLARIERDWGEPGAALGDAYRALHCRPDSAEIYNTLGTVMEALGQAQPAEEAFVRSVTLDARAAFAWSNLCHLAVAEGDGERAERLCATALLADPGLDSARNNLALAAALQGDVPRAEQRLFEDADVARAFFNVGVLRMSIGNYDEAAQAFDAAAALRPSDFTARRAIQARALAATREQKHVDR